MYRKEDFTGMYLNVHAVPKTSKVIERFPILKKHEVFQSKLPPNLDKDRVVRYIVYAFDPNSPLRHKTNVIERRMNAVELAGFKMRKDKYPDSIEEMVRSNVQAVNHMIIQYCIIAGGQHYNIFKSFEEALYKETSKLYNENERAKGEKVKDIISNITTLGEKIKHYETVIFSENDDTKLTADLYDFSAAENIRISPEDYAESKRAQV